MAAAAAPSAVAAPGLRPTNSQQLPRRRVSYLIPPPPAFQPPPRLALPTHEEAAAERRGNPNPLIKLAPSQNSQRPRSSSYSSSFYGSSVSSSSSSRGNGIGNHQRHPEHTLGITSLAIDTSTVIENPSSTSSSGCPGGILYSGGRDGLVAAWELNLPFKKRENLLGYRTDASSGRLKRSPYRPRWSEDVYESDEDDETDVKSDERETEQHSSDEDTRRLNDQPLRSSPRRRRVPSASRSRGDGLQLSLGELSLERPSSEPSAASKSQTDNPKVQLPYEKRWQIDEARLHGQTPPSTSFRQSHRAHTDWVNALLLCNLNQTLISASSDRTIRAWSPHDPQRSMSPATLGSHSDYVKCLAYAQDAGWLVSGGLDKKVKVWDVSESRIAPIVEFGADASLYALAANRTGSTVACGTPDRIIQVYDPRTSDVVARLVGHADNVRSLIISTDGKHILSASSDATVKLWSLSMQRCLHTFAHHSESVWALHSVHPHLETFYSGDRAGVVCKVDFADCGDIASEGECVILARSSDQSQTERPSVLDGINSIVSVDDTYVWTSSGSSSILRWKDVPPRLSRVRATAARDYQATAQPADTSALFSNSPPSAGRFVGSSPLGQRDTEDNPLKRTSSAGLGHSVSFAASLAPSQKATPRQDLGALHRPSSLKFASRQALGYGGSSSSPISTSTNLGAQRLNPATSPLSDDIDPELPALNGIPLESLVPLSTSDDPYGGGVLINRGAGLGGHGYSASVLSLHRTASRPTLSNALLPFGPVFQPSSYTPPSSNIMAPRPPLSSLVSGRPVSPTPNQFSYKAGRSTSIAEESGEDAVLISTGKGLDEKLRAAQADYLERESALDGVPLRGKPDTTIEGRHGLVRAEMLSDRRTVLAVDTLGEITAWDIVLGCCIGQFNDLEITQRFKTEHDSGDQPASSEAHQNPAQADLLHYLKVLLEGEAVVQPWCSVETKTGLLTVHIDQGRAFDAEVYLDEAGIPYKPEYRTDQRLNLGKWVLRSLFDGFIKAEVRNQSRRRSSSAASVGSPGAPQPDRDLSPRPQKKPSFISMPDDFQTSNMDEDAWNKHSGSHFTALATPAATPAVLPDAADLAAHLASPRMLSTSITSSSSHSTLPTIPQSPLSLSKPVTPLSSLQKDGDYFSRPKNGSTETPGGSVTPKPGTLNPIALGQPNLVINKPSRMSRLKTFGRKDTRKDANGEQSMPASGDERGLPSEDDQAARANAAEEAQQLLLNAILSHAFQPSPWLETPPIRFPPDMTVIIGEEAHDAGAWATVYRGLVNRTGNDVSTLEQCMPPWLLEYCLHNVIQVKEQPKIAFVLEPWQGPGHDGLAPLPSGNARLSATRMLRMRKVCHYVAEKLELESWRQKQKYQAEHQLGSGTLVRSHTETSLSSTLSYGQQSRGNVSSTDEQTILPEDEIEILCNDQVVPLNITLAACAKFVYGKGGDVLLSYRKR